MTANPNSGNAPVTLSGMVANFRQNFMERQIEIVPGLYFNQYQTIKSVYYALHNTFESGPKDENGDPKYWYDLMTDRNDQVTKNIDLDTKDCYIKSEGPGSYLKSWLLRREYMAYAKTTGWGKKLNAISADLPAFGTVVWKKCGSGKNVDVAAVELINLMNDPSVESLKDGLVIERHQMTQYEIYAKKKAWNVTAINALISSGQTVARTGYIPLNNQIVTTQSFINRVDVTTPFYDVYEMWGEIPRDLYEATRTDKKDVAEPNVYTPVTVSYADANESSQKRNETVYVMAVVANIDVNNGTDCVLFCKEVDRDLFPYKEVHLRRKKGRWLGMGNYELCFPLIEKANEATNRFFASLRIALLHLYQTRDNLHVKNVLTDLLDGDVVVTKSELTAIPTEVRGLQEYKTELANIEQKADRLCSSFEVVTGANLPAGTPFKLGYQQLQVATKFFEYVQENEGLFIEEVFNQWLLPGFADALSEEHVLDMIDDMEGIELYYSACKKVFQYKVLKEYILENNTYPDPQELSMVGDLAVDQIKKGPKQVKIMKDYYKDQKYSIQVQITGENNTKKENLETLSNTFQILAANPQAMQDKRLMKILGMVLEQAGYSPLEINEVNEAPTNPSLNPANQGGGGAEIAAGGEGIPGVGIPGMSKAGTGAGAVA